MRFVVLILLLSNILLSNAHVKWAEEGGSLFSAPNGHQSTPNSDIPILDSLSSAAFTLNPENKTVPWVIFPECKDGHEPEFTIHSISGFTEVNLLTIRKELLSHMVFVKGGTFQMGSTEGSDDEKPIHQVTVSDFYICNYEVTFEEYDAYCEVTGKNKPDDFSWGRARRPVINVNWNDAVAYCNWRSQQEGYQPVYTIRGNEITVHWGANGYRLPTEAEWEYAARGRGETDKWAGTSLEGELALFANYGEPGDSDKDGYEYTAPAGSFKANKLTLHDMGGNVWEWCWDWYSRDHYENSSNHNPKGPIVGSYRVLRGGSWGNMPAVIRCTNRNACDPDFRRLNLGFRLARTAE